MASQIAEFYAKISADTTGMQKGLADLNAKLDAAKDKAEKTGGKGGGGLGALTSGLSKFINPTSLATAALAGLTVFLKQSIAAANEAAKVDAK